MESVASTSVSREAVSAASEPFAGMLKRSSSTRDMQNLPEVARAKVRGSVHNRLYAVSHGSPERAKGARWE
ncbi:hypothetical protein GCM10020229_80590 [Kitasatospora albolonga]